jgi:hypothetical protein
MNHTKSIVVMACLIAMSSCKKEANVATLDAQNITRTSARLMGRVEDDNKREVTSRGIVYGTFANPNINNNRAASGSGVGTYAVDLQLDPNTKYYWRAYATTKKGTSYGEEKSFTTRKYQSFSFGEHTIEVYDADNALGHKWGIADTTTGANSIDDGVTNTNKLAGYAEEHAAKICAQLVANGQSDWYLPSANELNAMYSNRLNLGLGTGVYWSSTEADSMHAYAQDLGSGFQMNLLKSQAANCRCVRRD